MLRGFQTGSLLLLLAIVGFTLTGFAPADDRAPDVPVATAGADVATHGQWTVDAIMPEEGRRSLPTMALDPVDLQPVSIAGADTRSPFPDVGDAVYYARYPVVRAGSPTPEEALQVAEGALKGAKEASPPGSIWSHLFGFLASILPVLAFWGGAVNERSKARK